MLGHVLRAPLPSKVANDPSSPIAGRVVRMMHLPTPLGSLQRSQQGETASDATPENCPQRVNAAVRGDKGHNAAPNRGDDDIPSGSKDHGRRLRGRTGQLN